MALEMKPKRTRPIGVSFRFSEEAAHQLKVLADALNLSQVEIVEGLLADEYEKAKKKYPSEIRAAEAKNK